MLWFIVGLIYGSVLFVVWSWLVAAGRADERAEQAQAQRARERAVLTQLQEELQRLRVV